MVSLVAVVWKLWSPEEQGLACVAEELALAALIDRAEVERVLEGKESSYSLFFDLAFEDTDYKWLYEPSMDGLEDEREPFGPANLRFEDWFKPFEGAYIHPYVGEETQPD